MGFSRQEYWSGAPLPSPLKAYNDPQINLNQENESSHELLLQTCSLAKIYMYLYPDFGEGNGNPLQYSCLENPMDGGAW